MKTKGSGLKRIFIVLLFALSISASVVANAQSITDEELQQWMTFYYQNPRPELVVPAIRRFSEDGFLARENMAAPFLGFFSAVLRQNPASLVGWMRDLAMLPDEELKLLSTAIWLADIPAGKEALSALVDQKPTIGNNIKKMMEMPPPQVETIEIDSPAVLDFLWGRFLATGDEVYVVRIISVLPWAEVKGDIPKLLIGGAARWSLESNAEQHAKVLSICKRELRTQRHEVVRILKEVIEKAEGSRLGAPAEESVSREKMSFFEYRFISPEVQESTFGATSRKLWRIGFKYMRLEEAPDPAEGIHGLIIGKSPDSYMINLYDKKGQHIVDRAENTDIHVPVFQDSDLPQKILGLEMGNEIEFFRANKAMEVGDKTIDGILCSTYQLNVEGIDLLLHTRKDNGKPLQVDIKNETYAYSVRYDQYNTEMEADYSLFKVPAGIEVIDVN